MPHSTLFSLQKNRFKKASGCPMAPVAAAQRDELVGCNRLAGVTAMFFA
jgi:hypothetical protein